jgi:CheY-like chemotaxis protein
MVVEDDPVFASLLAELGREQGFKVVVATRGVDALATARELRPNAITFDVGLPDFDGWRLLDRLKDDPDTRHVPVFLISGTNTPERGLRSGAVGVLTKPVDRGQLAAALGRLVQVVEKPVKSLLVVGSDAARLDEVAQIIGNGDVEIASAAAGEPALQALAAKPFDCVVLGLHGEGVPALDMLRQLERGSNSPAPPIVLYAPGPLPDDVEAQLRALGPGLVLKDARSPERLLDETALFLHRDTSRMSEDKRAILKRLHSSAEVLAGRTVLIVDDDVRNIFAMTSLLERHGMQVVSAENGKDALHRLRSTPEVDVVLMDIMLPGMDGYETTRAMRRVPEWRNLPIIALTAKAMQGDREKCLEAGASDYIAKPVEAEYLIANLRSWLHR